METDREVHDMETEVRDSTYHKNGHQCITVVHEEDIKIGSQKSLHNESKHHKGRLQLLSKLSWVR